MGGQVLCRKGVMVHRPFDRPRQNKANCAKQSQLCETNPISWQCQPGRGQRAWDEEANAQNEPNLARGAGRPPSPRPRRLCKTNPISRLRIADFGLRIQDSPATGCSLSPAPRPRRGWTARVLSPQSRIVRNEPNFSPATPRQAGTFVRNKAKPGRTGISGGRRMAEPVVRNKPNWYHVSSLCKEIV
jgi:hypothetical protein